MNSESQALAAEIKVALVREPDLKAAPLNIRVEQGTVIIDGFVDTEDQRERVRAVAASVDGVDRVRIHIEVK